ncbi:MAG: hypothetical protein KKG99_00225 [Bacteroidetes bacterium]|nr:hypothetical protein [Bacteroidota bacterium]
MKTKIVFAALIIVLFTFTISNAQDSIHSKVPTQTKAITENLSKDNGKIGFFELWLIPISQIITMLSVSVGIIIAICQYRLKVQEEIRLSKSAQAENDVKLLKLFSETFDIAHSRKINVLSEKVIEKLFDKDIIEKKDFGDLNNLTDVTKKLDIAARVLPVGAGSQVAAIAAIGSLGLAYEVLQEPALKGLLSLKSQGINDPTEEYIRKIKAKMNV